ncbi:sigma-70 family RNA polymerase sigma factor [Acrocarpospora sp. B8E8]|uniref:RNA polymerase sigma factor n=1 Tax=Acrocarpospora sp. B8E8 TaxID=3153572 RepID=UPI00325D7E19
MSVEVRQSDAELLDAIRGGNASAYGTLYARHAAAARSLARQLVQSEAEVEDVVAETFTKILDLISRGGGPQDAFRPYLLTSVRRMIYDRTAADRHNVTTDEIERFDPGVPFVDPALAGLERSLVARAFLSLPERWRMVLWHTEVENAKAADIAPMLGLSANGVAALAYRAREGLRQAYLQMHLATAPRQACRPVLGKMGSYVRGGLAKRETRVVDDHVGECTDCREVFLELTDVNQGLRVIIGPLIVGPVLAGYLAGLGKTGASVLGGAGWFRRMPKSQQAAAAGAVAAAVAGVAFLLASGEEPRPPKPVALAPIPSPPTVVPEPEPPVERPRPSPVRAEPTPQPPPTKRVTRPELVASIDPLGALVRDKPGIVGMRLRNHGSGPTEELTASIHLPRGVSVLASGGGYGNAVDPAGSVDGWTCRTDDSIRCVRQALPAGDTTSLFLRVHVAEDAPEGTGPSLRIRAGDLKLKATSPAGVRSAGATARFAADGRVLTRVAGNTLLSCPAVQPGCDDARHREPGRRDNDLWSMVPLDQDDDEETRASSWHKLDLPDDARVVWAGLYWSGSGSRARKVLLRGPGEKQYTAVRPGDVTKAAMPIGSGYQAFADVTRLVREGGRWWVADDSVVPGVSRHAGWALVVVAAQRRQPYSQAAVLDAATLIKDGSLTVPLNGLTPTASPARLDLVVWDGDADLTGDTVKLGDTALRPDGGDRDPANVFDGSTTGDWNTFGLDVDTFHPILGREPVLRIGTKRDVLLIGVAAVSVPARS